MSSAGGRLGIDFGTLTTVAALAAPDGRLHTMRFDSDLPGGAPRDLPPVEAVATVLTRVAAAAGPLPAVVLTHPAAWRQDRRRMLLDAARLAGLAAAGDPALLPEPVAAAQYYTAFLERPIRPGTCLVVYDLGAGAFDVSVVRGAADGLAVAAGGGLSDAGGLDLDAAVVQLARLRTGGAGAGLNPAWDRLDRPRTPEEAAARLRLWHGARAAREELSAAPLAELYVPLIGPLTIARDDLEHAVAPLLARTVERTVAALREAWVAPQDLAGVLLVGGASVTPLAAELLHRALGVAPVVAEHPDLAVAVGSVQAAAAAVPPAPARVPARPRPRPALLRTFSPGGIVRGAPPVNAVAISPDGRLLAAGGDDRRVRVWDLETGRLRHTLADHDGPVRALAFAADGSLLATAGGHPRRPARTLRIWHCGDGRRRHAFDTDPGGPAALAVHPTGRVLAAGGTDGAIRLFDPAEGRPLARRAPGGPGVNGLAFSPDGSCLAAADDDGITVHRAWATFADPDTPLHGDPAGTLRVGRGGVLGVAFGGPLLAGAGRDGSVRLWDAASGAPHATLEGHTDPVAAVAFDPTGTLLASGGLDTTIRLWDPAAGAHLHRLDGHDGAVRALAFAPDGAVLATAGADGAVRLWSVGGRG